MFKGVDATFWHMTVACFSGLLGFAQQAGGVAGVDPGLCDVAGDHGSGTNDHVVTDIDG